MVLFWFYLCTFRNEFKSRAVNRAGVVVSRVMNGVVKGHRPHNIYTGPGSVCWMVLHFLHLGALKKTKNNKSVKITSQRFGIFFHLFVCSIVVSVLTAIDVFLIVDIHLHHPDQHA